MYKLLLVTDREDVRAAFEAVPDWETLNFRQPRAVSSVEEAEPLLGKSDAVAIALPIAEEDRLLVLLEERHPLLPMMEATADPQLVREYAQELGQVLNRINADYSNDRYDKAEMLLLCRHAFFRDLIRGRIAGREAMLRRMRLLRSRMDPNRPCAMLTMNLPEDDGYLSGHWRYGPDRLEVAMRNIFGAELHGMRVLVSVLSDKQFDLVACPMLHCDAPSGERMMELVRQHAQEGIDHVREYLDIDLTIASSEMLDSLAVLANVQPEKGR